jgi:hypothetical protein
MLFFGFNYVVYESRCVVVLNPLPLINLPKQQQQSGKYDFDLGFEFLERSRILISIWVLSF